LPGDFDAARTIPGALPVGILPPPHKLHEVRFNAPRQRSLLDLAALGLLLSSAFQASLSNPALRILLRAFAVARNAIHGIPQARLFTPRRA